MSGRILRWLVTTGVLMLLTVGRASAQGGSNPHGNSIGACATCHLPDGWKPVRIASTFRHAEKVFPLDGAHASAKCASCHASLDFSKASAKCASCHSDVHRGELGPDCARCHTTRSFVDQARLARVHETTRFPLRGAHAATPCESCHTPTAAGQPQFANRPTTCISCHRADYDRAKAPPHAGLPTNCNSCHTETAWRGAPFNHNTTQFPLSGAHQATPCSACHADGVFKGKPTTCVSCHQPDYARTVSPPHGAAAFATTCATCHTTTAWLGAPFDHNTTQFPLTGGHKTANCSSCHADGRYHGRPTTCVSCHQADFDRTATPPHVAAAFSTSCTTCHTTTVWLGAAFNHSTTQFPLTGSHQALACTSCHADRVYHGKPTACATCHQADYDRTTTPPHAAAAFSTSCATCHATTRWLGTPFDHRVTQFPLTGSHQTVACASCHGDGVYHGKPTACTTCHQADYARATPPHQAAGFSTTCGTCHTTSTWLGAPFDHNSTQFPLAGAHLTVACASCHADGVYRGKPTSCVSCHRTDYDRTTTPSHSAAGYSTDCTTCHSAASWQSATFNHNTTQFPLTGGHATVPCSSCHGDGVFRGKPTACVACHQATYNATTSPPHAAAAFSTGCATCHTTTAWQGAPFNHTATQFPLTGAHATVSCASCHGDGVYRNKPTTCVSCHQSEYARTTNPSHSAAGYSTACATCHTTSTWLGATFNHSTTQFPLTGAHLAVACTACHSDGVFKGKPTTCVSCHQAEYARTTTPPHAAAGFANTCATCHATTSWLTATFNHSTATTFPLTGVHTNTPCASCHGDGVYKGKSTACASCHTPEYNTTTNPNHKTAVFPMTCESCHTTGTWLGATFDHDPTYFPIYSGAHRNRWTKCSDCHTSSSDFKVFTCTTCHLQGPMDSKHRGKSGYVYQSSRCYSCHPRGKAG